MKERLYEDLMVMSEFELASFLSKEGATDEMRKLASRAGVEAAMRKSVHLWFKAPPELRSTPEQLGNRISEIAAEWLTSQLSSQNRGTENG